MYKRNPEVATQPLFFGKIEDVAYEKVLCLIYPNFSLYEITALTSTLALSLIVRLIMPLQIIRWWSLRMACPVNRPKH